MLHNVSFRHILILIAIFMLCAIVITFSAARPSFAEPPAQSASVKWEYKVVPADLSVVGNATQFEKLLAPLGQDGWELIQWTQVNLVFKRAQGQVPSTSSGQPAAGPTPTRTKAQIFGITINSTDKEGALIVQSTCSKVTAYLLDQNEERGQSFLVESHYYSSEELQSYESHVAIFPKLVPGTYEIDPSCEQSKNVTVFPGAIVEVEF